MLHIYKHTCIHAYIQFACIDMYIFDAILVCLCVVKNAKKFLLCKTSMLRGL